MDIWVTVRKCHVYSEQSLGPNLPLVFGIPCTSPSPTPVAAALAEWPCQHRTGSVAKMQPAEFLGEPGKLRQLGHYYACSYSHRQLAL